MLPPGIDLDLCLFSGQVFRWKRAPGCCYFGVDGDHTYQISPRSGEDRGHIFQTLASETEAMSFFNATCDVESIERQIVGLAPELQSSLTALRGLRVLKPSDPTEVFFSFLCTANNHIKRITAMVAKLAEYGDPLDESCNKRFPRCGLIASIPEAELREKGFGYRGATIPHAACQVMSRGGDSYLEGLATVGYDQAHKELISIKGIGHKIADCICLYGLHYHEAVPVDTHLWQAACRVFFPEHAGKALTEARYREIGDFFRDRFGNLAGWAHLYLYFDNMQRRRSALPHAK